MRLQSKSGKNAELLEANKLIERENAPHCLLAYSRFSSLNTSTVSGMDYGQAVAWFEEYRDTIEEEIHKECGGLEQCLEMEIDTIRIN